ncbi:NAD(P)H-dependent glycerol-3-phosphate dehydrogenase [Cochlodiniinecator piscidefendens]|uniref:NAD(P)H-dependent glycerol-3-phosphate dehydrogenase n=1 Tax=Cochlodiniinecator piscidefendens TaxID=2715756 RepID=UPI001408379A|nr:NAD(P)H-dependent glycerol-3-phosphate dehydrogenase [Cochlodiniinecator piscidefendens]
MSISIIGAGAFGTALAISLSRDGQPVTLWARKGAEAMQTSRKNGARLPGVPLPDSLTVTSDFATATRADTLLLAVPMQSLNSVLETNSDCFSHKTLVACCKGIDLKNLRGPTALISQTVPNATAAILTGPSFAADIARGLPTALTLACATDTDELQQQLSTSNLRLYRTTDTTGAELGGALKNVVAIACGIAIGAGLGESARAAVMTRGYAEMQRLAAALGARSETLSGLSGFGDLALTCTSEQSRNYRFGVSLGQGKTFDAAVTVEGAATSKAVSNLAKTQNIDLPIATTIAALLDQNLTVEAAITALLSRPLKKE